MIKTSVEFIILRSENDPRATHDSASELVWNDVIDSFPTYKTWVIHNKTVPLTILKRLSQDSEPEIRAVVATKRKIDLELFEKLSRDEDETVRHAIVWNPKTPVSVLEYLKNDLVSMVAETATERLLTKG